MDYFLEQRTYMCRRSDNSNKYAATILKKNEKNEFYVHYVDLDKRLDEWVTVDKLGEEVFLPVKNDKKRSFTDDSAVVPHVRSDYAIIHEMTKVRNINMIQLGAHEIGCWYYSPYPKEYNRCSKLYICEQTFKYFKSKSSYAKHLSTIDPHSPPPGTKIYQDNETRVSVYEIDGETQTLFGQNICLFGKLFIEHKTLAFDPSPFFFYVLYEQDDSGLHPVGYFSKEKKSAEKYNLACILTLPPFQRKGYGKFIISLSYEISKKLGEVGSPEKPLSDLGKLSYRSYWSFVLLDYFEKLPDDIFSTLTITKISADTGFKIDDIISTMQHLEMVQSLKGQYVININRAEIALTLEPYMNRRYPSSFCDPCYLNMHRS